MSSSYDLWYEATEGDAPRPSESVQPVYQRPEPLPSGIPVLREAVISAVDFIPLTGEYDGDGPILWQPVKGYPQIYKVSADGSSESCRGIWGKYYFLNNTDDGLYGPYDSFNGCVDALRVYMTLH